MQRLGDMTIQNTPEHPVIQNMMRTGYPDGREPEYPHCPVCGSECETVYMDECRDIVACDVCLREQDAWDVPACFERR